MKYLKLFNESGTLRTFYRLQKSDIQEILDIFTELVDEGFDLINKDEQEQWISYLKSIPNTQKVHHQSKFL